MRIGGNIRREERNKKGTEITQTKKYGTIRQRKEEGEE
jgi:hypothetical protein